MPRLRNARSTYLLKDVNPISDNYYPVTSTILIRDPKKAVEVAILTDRAQGGSSLTDGQLELMVS